MGLIKAATGSLGGILADQWKEYFYCDSLDADVLMAKGSKRTTKRSTNKGTDNLITNGSVIAVNEGQCMMIVEQGQIVEFAAEAGEYTWDSSTESTDATLTDGTETSAPVDSASGDSSLAVILICAVCGLVLVGAAAVFLLLRKKHRCANNFLRFCGSAQTAEPYWSPATSH